MADIQQAAKWMEEGMRVRRKSWASKKYCLWQEYGGITSRLGELFQMRIDHLLAEDWEPAPESHKESNDESA